MEAVTHLSRILIIVALLSHAAQLRAQDATPTTPAAKGSKAAGAGDPLLGKLSLSSQQEPIAIVADSLEFDYRSRLLTYKGHVVVTQGDLKLEADTLRVELEDTGNTAAGKTEATKNEGSKAETGKAEASKTEAGKTDADKADARIKEVVAVGNVRMDKGTRSATAGRGVFDQAKRIVTLSENAVLHDGPNQVNGERVVVYLDEERSVVDGGSGSGRVKAMLYPNRDQQAKKEQP